jgi:adenylate cyclase
LVRDEVVDPTILSHGGRIVKTAGDGLVAEFSSALAALRAAVIVQREMATRNLDVSADGRIELPFGINLGDVMVDGNDLAGDGINVAARLESLADPGGICVSGSVREQVHGSLDVGFDDIGERQVKNIARSDTSVCCSDRCARLQHFARTIRNPGCPQSHVRLIRS